MQRSERVCDVRPSFYARISWEQFTRRRKEGEAGETQLAVEGERMRGGAGWYGAEGAEGKQEQTYFR